MSSYIPIAALALMGTLGLLAITKIPSIVLLFASTIAAGGMTVYERLQLGHWDPFAGFAFVYAWLFAAIVAFVTLALGRQIGWRFFVGSDADAASANSAP